MTFKDGQNAKVKMCRDAAFEGYSKYLYSTLEIHINSVFMSRLLFSLTINNHISRVSHFHGTIQHTVILTRFPGIEIRL